MQLYKCRKSPYKENSMGEEHCVSPLRLASLESNYDILRRKLNAILQMVIAISI